MLCRNCMGYGTTTRVSFDERGEMHMVDVACPACEQTGSVEDGHLEEPHTGVRPAPWYV